MLVLLGIELQHLFFLIHPILLLHLLPGLKESLERPAGERQWLPWMRIRSVLTAWGRWRHLDPSLEPEGGPWGPEWNGIQ